VRGYSAPDKLQLLQTTIDSSLDLIQVFEAVRNDEGRIIDFIWILNNEASVRVYGDVIGKRLLLLQPGVVEEGIIDAFKQVVESGVPQQYEKHYVHEQFNGWFYQSVVKLNDGVATTTADITARKKAEEGLRLAKQSLQATLDSFPYVIQAFEAVRQADGTIVDFTWVFTNSSWNKLYGDVIGKRLLQQNPGVVETGLFEKFVQVTETGITIDHEQYYSLEQFHEQWFHQTLTKLGDGFVMHVQDITERKRSDAEILRLKDEIAQKAVDKYKALFDSIDEGFAIQEVITDKDKNVTDLIYREVNGAFEKQTGMQGALGRRVREFVPHIEQAFLDALTQVYQTGEPLRNEGHAADLDRWFSYHYSRIGGAGSPLIAVVFNDITERKRREQQKEYLLLLNDALRPLVDPVAVQQKAMEILGMHLKVDRVIYADINVEEDYFEVNDNYTTAGVQKITGRFPFSAFGSSVEILKRGEILVIDDVSVAVADDDDKSQFFAIDVQAVVAVPLVKAGKLVVDLSIHQTMPRRWRAEEIVLLQETAERTWAAVEKAKAEEALRKTQDAYRIQLEHEVRDRTLALLANRDELEREQHFLEQVTDKAPLLIYVYDLKEERFTYINKRVEALIGKSEDYVYAMGPHLFQAILHPEDLSGYTAYMQGLKHLSGGQVTENDFRVWNGTQFRWFRSRDSVFREEKKHVLQVIGIAEDVTYEKMLEEKLKNKGPIGLN